MKRYLLSLLVFFLVSSQKTYATHALGGDIMYEVIGPNQYEVTLRVYRDCNGINLGNSATITWTGSCGSGNATATRISNLDITPICPSLPTACAGGSGTLGIEEHTYVATITLPAGCTDIRFAYSLCCRNNSITTVTNPGGENIYIFADHETGSVVNHSPVFNNVPSPIVCVNQPVLYNHGVFDPDGDSLVFIQSNCYEANNNVIEYAAGFNGTNPLITANPIVVNPQTGAISFTPTSVQVGVMCIVVQEYRNGVFIGETIRDIQFTVVACSNTPPVSSGINNTPGNDSLNFVMNVCENNQVCFDISFSDVNMNNMTISWNQEIPSANFQVFNNSSQTPTAQFCWSPTPADIGLNFFSVNVIDDACPVVGNSTYTYTIQVQPNPNSINLTYDNTICSNESSLLSLTTSSTPDSIVWQANPSLNTADPYNPIASPATSTTYYVEVFFGGGCNISDSAVIQVYTDPLVQAFANTNNICNGGTAFLYGQGAAFYTWNNGVVDSIPFTPPAGITDYILTGSTVDGCIAYDTVQLVVNPVLGIVANPGPIPCLGDSISLNASGAFTYVWNNGVTDGQNFVPPLGTTTYVLTGTDVNGCVAQDSIDITVNPLPSVVANTSDNNVCIGTSIVLSGSGAVSYTWNNGVTDGQSFVPPVGTTTYVVTGTDANGCVNYDSIDIVVNDLPVVVANTSDNNVCIGTNIVLSGSGAAAYTWNNGVIDGQSFVPPVGTATYIVTGTDANGCIYQDSIDIVVNPLPVVVANTSDNNVCIGTSIVLSGSGAVSYTWNNGVTDGQSFSPPVGTTTYVVTGTDANGCVAQDSIDVTVNPLPSVLANTSDNNVCIGTSIPLSGSGALTYTWNNGGSRRTKFRSASRYYYLCSHWY
ncbi:MAG: hypothetical protein H6579_06985 [Chitinophagales bacterium]|nr:hypothetical protein [Chitinophagales bacterium]